MDIKDYNKMVKIADKSKDLITDELADTMLETMSSTFEIIEDYCKKSIPEFELRGRIVNKIFLDKEEITQEIDIFYDNKPLDKSEQSKHVDILNQLLTGSYNEIGWEIE